MQKPGLNRIVAVSCEEELCFLEGARVSRLTILLQKMADSHICHITSLVESECGPPCAFSVAEVFSICIVRRLGTQGPISPSLIRHINFVHSRHCFGIMATRAIVYENNGDPASVLYAVTLPPPGPLSGRSISVKVLLSPINPSDVHVVHGSYTVQPVPREHHVNGEKKTLYFPGNEGLGEITEIGPDVRRLKRGDQVVFSKGQSGTWSSAQVLEEEDVIKVDSGSGISAVNASTLAVSRSIET